MKLFLNHGHAADETARAITARIQNTDVSEEAVCDKESNEEKLLHLWAYIVDIIQAAPSATVLTNMMALLAAIARLPSGPNLEDPEPWADLPRFATYFSDTWDADYAWHGSRLPQNTADAAADAERVAVWVNMNAFAGIALSRGTFAKEMFAGMGIALLHDASSHDELENWTRLCEDVVAALRFLELGGRALYDGGNLYSAGSDIEAGRKKWAEWMGGFAKIVRGDSGEAPALVKEAASQAVAVMQDIERTKT